MLSDIARSAKAFKTKRRPSAVATVRTLLCRSVRSHWFVGARTDSPAHPTKISLLIGFTVCSAILGQGQRGKEFVQSANKKNQSVLFYT